MIDIGFKNSAGTIKYLSDFDGFLQTTPWISGASGKFSQKIIEREGIPGAIIIGDRKLDTGTVKINFEYCNDNYATFITRINEFLFYAQSAEYIVHIDTDNSISREIKVTLKSWNIPFNNGELLLNTSGSLTFTMLKPYWEDVEYNETTLAYWTGYSFITVINAGNLPVRPLIEADAYRQAGRSYVGVYFYVEETQEGIWIQNTIWGTTAQKNMMYIDCEGGTIALSGIVQNTNEINSLYNETGFFNIPPGTHKIYIGNYYIKGSNDRLLTFKHKNRYMV